MSNYLSLSKSFNTGYVNVPSDYRELQGLQSQNFSSMCPGLGCLPCPQRPLCNANVYYGPSNNITPFCTQNIQSPESPYFQPYGPCPFIVEKKKTSTIDLSLDYSNFVKHTFKSTNWENPCNCCKKKMHTLGEHFKSKNDKEISTESNIVGNKKTGTHQGSACSVAMGKTGMVACAYDTGDPNNEAPGLNQCGANFATEAGLSTAQCMNSCACNCACTETVDGGPEANVLVGSGGVCGDQQWFLGWGGEGGGNQCQQTWSCQDYQSGPQNLPQGSFETMGENVVSGPNSWVSTSNYYSGANQLLSKPSGLSNIVDKSSIEQQHSNSFIKHKLNKHGIREIM